MLAQLDDDLGRLLADRTQTLLVNLDDSATRMNVSLLQPERAARVSAFVAEAELPDVLEPEFVEALQEVLSGLVKVVVTAEDLKTALLAGGSPASPTETAPCASSPVPVDRRENNGRSACGSAGGVCRTSRSGSS